MLTELQISDFALVGRISVEFGPGLNVLTGETGAGKSIVIDAIGSVLGDRCGPEQIRSGAERARIDALFRIDAEPAGIEPGDRSERLTPESMAEERLLLISRDISRTGRSGVRINGRPATLAMVREVTERLVDVHGQHEHQSLLSPAAHGAILDLWIGAAALKARAAVASAFRRWGGLKRERARLVTDERERIRRIDLLRFQAEEIDAARLGQGEEEQLIAQRARLVGAERLFASAGEALEFLAGDDQGALERIGPAVHRLREALSIDPELGALVESIDGARFTLEEAVRELRAYREGIEFNPDRLSEVEERVDLLRGLQRKYGDTIDEILAHGRDAAQELAGLERVEERGQELDAATAAAAAELGDRCLGLSAIRREAAPRLEKAVQRELADLGMERARFEVAIQPAAPSPSGAERIEFLLSANLGEPMKPLARVASGGELSRIMLALKSIAAGEVPVMIFDEIDVGVGGRTGSTLAAKLRALGERGQVLCVTHLPQIAAAAHRHFAILKREEAGRTLVHVEEMQGESRVQEVARMLGGDTAAAIGHARELLGRDGARPATVHV